MTRHTPGRRAGFTLVELLVAMAVIVVLATIAIAVVPSAIEQDRTTDAASTIRQHLMIAKARATRENNGRGIRFILDGGLSDPMRASAVGTDGVRYGGFLSTEMQYIEAAPTIVPNPLGLTTADPVSSVEPPYVDLSNGLTFTLKNVPAASEVYKVIKNDLGANWFPKLICPELGRDSFGRPLRFEIYDIQPISGNDWTLTVGYNPPNLPPASTLLGAGTAQRSYRFAVEPRSRPILGEPNVPLPKNVCVDLNANVSKPGASDPSGAGRPIDFEVMFAPNGQVIDPQTSGMIYLWVRDYSKLDPTTGLAVDMRPTTTSPALNYGSQRQFQLGGEQQLVAIKAKSGALGVFPVNWPDATGTYSAGDPYSLALKDANSP